jgi:hypothetical protein
MSQPLFSSNHWSDETGQVTAPTNDAHLLRGRHVRRRIGPFVGVPTTFLSAVGLVAMLARLPALRSRQLSWPSRSARSTSTRRNVLR